MNSRISHIHRDANEHENYLIRINNHGNLVISTRISSTVHCLYNKKMDFRYFPFDTHTCYLLISSFQYVKQDLVLEWGETPAILPHDDDKTDGKQQGFKLFDFKLINFKTKSIKILDSNNMPVSALIICFNFERDLKYYFFNSFLYPFVIVLVSQVSFFIDKTCQPARCTFGSMTILTLMTFIINERKTLPTVAYVMAYDVY